MDPERWRHVETLYHATLARPVGERAAFLAEACAGDEWLRREVQSLLDQPGSGHGAFEGGALALAANGFAPSASGGSLIGRRIGPYEVTAHLGAGGMGEVFRAHDTTLGRDVAIKILPGIFTSDPDRLARFEREARMLASLNHPHIGAIYGVEQSEGGPALILELVEGPTLAERLARGPIPLTESLGIASQIVDALDAAHERGIVHRDLKPGNIKITPAGTVKVLDFGLAKAAASHGDLSLSLAADAGGTREGVILGTPSYMSPEQARGLAVDKRTDIWAFGCLLYEMLTGRTAFAGGTVSDTIAAILEREPDWNTLPPTTAAPIRRLLRRCLEKDRKRRLDSATGLRLEIDDAMAAPATETLALAVPARRVEPVAVVALAVGAVIAGLVAWVLMRPALVAPVLPSRFAIVPPPAQPLNSTGDDRDVAVSPDGRHFVYLGGGTLGAGAPLMVRAINQLDARQLPVGGRAVFSSPDSRWIGFFTGAEIKKVSITGGAAITLGPVAGGPLGASWGDDNTIVFATSDPSTGLWRVSADGGAPTVLTTPDAAQGENDHAFPSVLPGGRGVLFTVTVAGQADSAQVAVLDLRTGQRKTLVRGGSQPEYVDPSAGTGQPGYLVYAAAGTLRAVRFDSDRLEVLGDSVAVIEPVMIKPTGAANYAVSREGTLFYVSGGVSVQMTPRSLVWVDRMGHEELIKAPLHAYVAPRVSPDGTRLALVVSDRGGSNIWIWDLAGETLRRVTFGPGIDGLPVWTPDGRRILFTSDRAGVFNLYSQAVDGSGAVARLTTNTNPQYPSSITPDGRLVIVESMASPAAPGLTNRARLFLLASSPSELRSGSSPGSSLSRTEPNGQTLFDGAWSEFSPDGHYLAYQSIGPGRPEVYVRPFPQVDSGRWQISTTGGTRPVWAPNGRELFYLDASNTLTGVPVPTSGSTFSFGTPAKVFDAKYATPFPPRQYDVSPEGQRFLMMKDSAPGDPSAAPASMVVVERWFEELKRLVPTK